MIVDFEDVDGIKHRCVTEYEINGETYYLTFGNNVYTQDENGKFARCEAPEELKPVLQPSRSMDVIGLDEYGAIKYGG